MWSWCIKISPLWGLVTSCGVCGYKDFTPTGFVLSKVPYLRDWLVGFNGILVGKSNPVGMISS